MRDDLKRCAIALKASDGSEGDLDDVWRMRKAIGRQREPKKRPEKTTESLVGNSFRSNQTVIGSY